MLEALPQKSWDYGTAAHLLNRAGFGGPPREIDRIAAMGLEGAVSHLVDFEATPDDTANPEWTKPDPDRGKYLLSIRNAEPEKRRELVQQEQRTQRQRILELKHWWLRRMAEGPRPLQEKMTLFWHGHFATSTEKVREANLMWRQNDIFRRMGTGSWPKLLVEVSKDPAMLVWLDQTQSKKQHPNENFAREVMELFTLGEGHYTEKDVTEAARALTGWTYDRLSGEFVARPFIHDFNEKTFLGKTGNFNGDDILKIIVEQPQASLFICCKLWNYFAGQPPSEETLRALAGVFDQGGKIFKPVLKAMFQSAEFYSDSIVRNQVKSPVQWLVGSVKVLERELPGPYICFGLTRNLGQDLFAPPNVKGWDGGLSWITTNNLLARYNEAAVLAQGDTAAAAAALMNAAPKRPQNAMYQERLQNARLPSADVRRILSNEERADKDKLIAALEKRFLQSRLGERQEKVLRDYLDSENNLEDKTILNAIRLVMSTPEYQIT